MYDCPLNKNFSEKQNETQKTLCDLCRVLYLEGWLNAIGGSISIRDGNKIYMGPIGTKVEQSCPLEFFLFEDKGKFLETKIKDFEFLEQKSLMILFYNLFNAGSVIHTHSMNAMLVTWLYQKDFMLSNELMSLYFPGLTELDACRVPIVENSSNEEKLIENIQESFKKNRNIHALLVEGHGAYFWGKDWVEAKGYADFFEMLFETAVKAKQNNL
ncbi:MAG: class II aldolase/adducin family protein [Elusimicrobia bacterium]|nr:class II aldolase/adducin family protein [Elusimicrobiota bacterium]